MHSGFLTEFKKQLAPVLELSSQSIYVYLDDENKFCNKHFSDLLGYESPDEWAAVDENFPTAFVAPASQHALIDAFQNAVGDGVASSLSVTWKGKAGNAIKTSVILVPLSINGHLAALHFISAL